MVGTQGPGCQYWCWHLSGNNIGIAAKTIAHIASQVLPFILPLAYFLLLPRPAAFMHQSSSTSYTLVPADDLETEIDDDLSAQDDVESRVEPKVTVRLSAADKWRLVKPMLLKYMLPLCEQSLLLAILICLIIYYQFVFIP